MIKPLPPLHPEIREMIVPSGWLISGVIRRQGPSRLAAAHSSSAATHRTTAMRPKSGRGGIHDAPAGSENDLQAIELARFAVTEHNNKTNGALEFERLVKVRRQVVAGIMHHFTLEVKEGGAKKLYEAKVWEKAWENFKGLHSFQPVDAA